MGLMKKLTSALVASSLVLGLVGTAFAAPSTEQLNDAYERLYHYGIVQGIAKPDGTQDPALGATLTRAQLVTILVRAFGGEDTANLLKGAKSYEDVAANEWYSGYVALIKNMAEKQGIAIGYEDGTFRPAQNVTAIEALAFVMKMLGVPTGTGANWVAETIAAAKDAGVITAADAEAYLADPNSPATRGLAFGLADAIFSTFEVAEGKTVYTTYVDDEAPVLTLDSAAEPTTTATTFTITGSVSGAQSLYFGSEQITANEDGTFSMEVNLEVGPNTFTFHAVDRAGNVTSQAFEITRNKGAAAKVAATLSSDSVAAGATAELTVVVTDENGVELDVAAEDIKVTVGGEIGTYADGVFTAATKAGTGTITVTVGDLAAEAINVTVVPGPLAKVGVDKASVGVSGKVTLTAQDEYGNAIEGATFSSDSADAFLNGNVFTAVKAGSYTVTATAGDKTATVVIGVFSTTVAKYGVTASAPSVIANNASEFTVTVKALDANGNHITSDTSTITWGAIAVSQFQVKNSAGTFVALNDGTAPVALTNGTLTVTLRTAAGVLGGQVSEISVAAGALTGKTSVELVDQVATSVGVTTKAKYVANNAGNENAAFSVTVLDQAGKAMKTGAWAVKVAVTGPAVLVDDTADSAPATSKDLVYSGTALTTYVRSKLGESGTVSVTATVEGLGSSSASVTALAAQSASKLEITQDKTTATANDVTTVTFTLQVTDAQGVPVAATPTTVKAKFAVENTQMGAISVDPGTASFSTLTALGTKEPLITFSATGAATVKVKAAAFVGNLKVTFADTATSGALAGGEYNIAFAADVATKVKLTRDTNINVPASAPETTLTAQLYDAAGNAAKVAGKSLTFSSASTDVVLNGGTNTVTVTTDAEGKATVTVKVLGYVGTAYVYTVTVNGATGSGISNYADGTENVTVTPTNAVATNLSLSIVNSLGNVTSTATAGDTLTLKATPKDAAGKILLGETITVEVTEGKTVAAVTVVDDGTGADATANDGVYTGTFQPTTSGRLTLTVKDTSSASEVSAPISVSVRAGTQAAVRVERADYSVLTLDTTSGAAKAFRIIPVDTYNNISAKTDGAITVTLTLDGVGGLALDAGKYFEIRSTADGANLISGSAATLTIPAGSTGVTFYVLSNDTTGVQVTVTSTSGNDGILTFTAK